MTRAILFTDRSDLLLPNPHERSYGCCVLDADNDGKPELFVGTVGGPNRLYKWRDGELCDVAPPILADAAGSAIGVAAADFSGNGLPDIYIINTSQFSGVDTDPDRLLINHGGLHFEDVMAGHMQRNTAAGRSVGWLDVMGDGRFSPFVCNYGAPARLYMRDGNGRIRDRAPEFNLDRSTGGRGVVCQDILASGRMDIFCVNENDQNALYRNLGNGSFEECAVALGVADRAHHGRGVQVADLNGIGRPGLLFCNWEAVHRLFVWSAEREQFVKLSEPDFSTPSRARSLIVADFDNDGCEEIFINNIGQPNRLLRILPGGAIELLPPGAAELPQGFGTGATVGDLNGDGFIDLFISHGEMGAQPNALLLGEPNGNHWLRVQALTVSGAPAIGAVVSCQSAVRRQTRWIDGGSGYLCQMEPIAHFGLGSDAGPQRVSVRFSTGEFREIEVSGVDTIVKVMARR